MREARPVGHGFALAGRETEAARARVRCGCVSTVEQRVAAPRRASEAPDACGGLYT